MFKRSRKKIVLSIMIPLFMLLALMLSVIMFASYRENRQRNTEMLGRYIDLYSLEQQPGNHDRPSDGPPDGLPPRNEAPAYELSTFYSVALSDSGEVLAFDNGEKSFYSEAELADIAKEILRGGKQSGTKDSLAYQVSEKDGYTLVVFLDNTVSQSSLQLLAKNVLFVGGAAVVILFLISLVLSKHIIKPLEENDRQQKQFISDASHELKTPVSVIGANAELLNREIGENEWLANIRYENERMGELVKQLLELSRAESKENSMGPVDFSRIVEGETLAFESLAFDQGKTILSEIESNLHLEGDSSQLSQLVSILLDNAIRHSTGSEINVSLARRGHTVVFGVANDGSEIPAEKLERLFDRFYRIDEARNSESQHYGLGLSIAKAVTEKHGGEITVSCSDGKVNFAVSLPLKK